MSSSAVILHCASCRIFCRTASDFLEACSSSNLQFDISHRSTSNQSHRTLPLALTMASSIANLLSVDAGAAPLFVYCVVQAFAVGDKNTGTRREKLFVILKHKFTTGHLLPVEMFLASRHTACLCSQQTAADNPLDLALPAQHRHRNATIRDACMYCKNEMTLL